MTSPTQRSLAWARDQGYLAQVVEHWNPFARVRQDLFGIVDIVCVSAKGTLAIQATSASNVNARVEKMRASESLKVLRDAGWAVQVHGWKKPTKKRRTWDVRIEEL